MMRHRLLPIVASLCLTGCVVPQTFTRDAPVPDNTNCIDSFHRWNKNTVPAPDVGPAPKSGKERKMDPTIGCAISRHQLEPSGLPTGQHTGWRRHVLEFVADGKPEHEPSLVKREAALRDSLSHARPKFLVFFVHGWRNDGSSDTEDPQRFNTLMAYTALHLEDRCAKLGMGNDQLAATDKRGTICGGRGDLVGVYIGWPGRKLYEFGTGEAWGVYAALTFNSVKKKSETLAQPVLQTIERVVGHAKQQRGGQTLSVVWGHSLGANLLLTGLTAPQTGPCKGTDGKPAPAKDAGNAATPCPSRIESSLNAWQKASDPTKTKPLLALPGADMYVLMNPATEASKWLEVQRLEMLARDKAPKSSGKEAFFSMAQPPKLVLVQSICEGRVDPRQHIPKPTYEAFRDKHCDEATKLHFSRNQRWLAWASKPEQIKAAGHFQAKGEHLSPELGLKQKRDDSKNPTIWYGPTHSLTNHTDSSVEPASSGLRHLIHTCKLSQCLASDDNWLYKARDRAGSAWDTGDTAKISQGDALQILYGYATTVTEHKDWPEKTPWQITSQIASDRFTPFWNMRADPSVVAAHGGYFSRRLFCHFNQLWLDAPARAK